MVFRELRHEIGWFQVRCGHGCPL